MVAAKAFKKDWLSMAVVVEFVGSFGIGVIQQGTTQPVIRTHVTYDTNIGERPAALAEARRLMNVIAAAN
jgi:hypothetical protein